MDNMKISVVVNTYNEEKNIGRCLKSVEDFAGETILVDMHSADKTLEIAKRYGAKVFFYEYTRYVEPARNFALSKASGEWILLLDADEEISPTLAKKLKEIIKKEKCDYVEIPRKNIIFNKWIEHSRWWPDYLVRFFKKGKVVFSDKIHVPPTTNGQKLTLLPTEENAIIHHNFQSIFQFIERLNRYTDIQSEELKKGGYRFTYEDLIIKPSNEFFSRFFAAEGYKDGLHGLSLAMLQGFSELVLYLKIWQTEDFEEKNITKSDKVFQNIINDYNYWRKKVNPDIFQNFYLKLKRKS